MPRERQSISFTASVYSLPVCVLSTGFLSDVTNTYNEAFYFSGAAIAICSCALSLVPVFAPMEARRSEEIKIASEELGERESSTGPGIS